MLLKDPLLIITRLALAPRYAGHGVLTVKYEQQSRIELQTLKITLHSLNCSDTNFKMSHLMAKKWWQKNDSPFKSSSPMF